MKGIAITKNKSVGRLKFLAAALVAAVSSWTSTGEAASRFTCEQSRDLYALFTGGAADIMFDCAGPVMDLKAAELDVRQNFANNIAVVCSYYTPRPQTAKRLSCRRQPSVPIFSGVAQTRTLPFATLRKGMDYRGIASCFGSATNQTLYTKPGVGNDDYQVDNVRDDQILVSYVCHLKGVISAANTALVKSFFQTQLIGGRHLVDNTAAFDFSNLRMSCRDLTSTSIACSGITVRSVAYGVISAE